MRLASSIFRFMPWFCSAVLALGPAARAADPAAAPGTGTETGAALRPAAPPLPQPPTAYFRRLLALGNTEREAALDNVAAPLREKLRAKLEEYTRLEPPEREGRLRATELHWYLAPLMDMPGTNRTAQLATVPAEYRSMVEEGLKKWDALPPDTRAVVRQNDTAFRNFVQLQTEPVPRPTYIVSPLPQPAQARLQGQWEAWQALPPEKRQRLCDRFRGFFELPPREKERTLNALSDEERKEMEDTLRAFERLSPDQRRACVASFRRFTDMSLGEWVQILRNAEHWKEMSPADRQTWRMLVKKLPPLPPQFGKPPMPPRVIGTNAARVVPAAPGGNR